MTATDWDVVQVIKPDPDSQYRLVPCDCGSTDVVYLRVVSPWCYDMPIKSPPEPSPHDMWRIRCNGCGKTGPHEQIRHHAQIFWNGRKKPSWERD